jgi:hypothetical protein
MAAFLENALLGRATLVTGGVGGLARPLPNYSRTGRVGRDLRTRRETHARDPDRMRAATKAKVLPMQLNLHEAGRTEVKCARHNPRRLVESQGIEERPGGDVVRHARLRADRHQHRVGIDQLGDYKSP